MSIWEVAVKTNREDITSKYDSIPVNDCIRHKCKPKFYRHVKKNKKRSDIPLLTATCLSDECGKICMDGEDIVGIWNKWNPNNK